MTEIQWLISIMTSHKLSATLAKAFLERIGEVETKLSAAPQAFVGYQRPMIAQPPGIAQQAASTLAKLQEHAGEAPTLSTAPIMVPPPSASRLPPFQEVVTSTTNGGSTKGPKKW